MDEIMERYIKARMRDQLQGAAHKISAAIGDAEWLVRENKDAPTDALDKALKHVQSLIADMRGDII